MEMCVLCSAYQQINDYCLPAVDLVNSMGLMVHASLDYNFVDVDVILNHKWLLR